MKTLSVGMEGAAANAQIKQLEHQNGRLKEAIVRYRPYTLSDWSNIHVLSECKT